MRAILVPVKSFRDAKHRLSPVLDNDQREYLARRLAQTVLDVNGTADLFVACDDGSVADWASSAGAFVLWTPGLGLSGAVESGVAYLAREGFDLAVVTHADLPMMTSLRSFGADGAVTLAPDRKLNGTNVAAVPTKAGFAFSYGPRSFTRHRAEAVRCGLPLHVVYDPRLASDVDVPADLEYATAQLEGAPVPHGGSMERDPVVISS
jgi:2-phospho-L-lactate guanylyltransferase